MKIYIAGPLYSQGEKEFNLTLDAFLTSQGYQTYLPQRDGGIITEMPDMIEGISKYDYVYQKDLQEMIDSDVFLYILDGRVPDEGAAVALGYSTAHRKHCIGYKTDTRSLCYGEDNLMIAKSLKAICHTPAELGAYLAALQAK